MSKKLLCTSLLFVSPWGLAAQLETLKLCVPIVGHIERLQCYDQSMRNIVKESDIQFGSVPINNSTIGEWVLTKKQNEEGELSIIASVNVDAQRSKAADDVSLYVSCYQNKPTTLSIDWLNYLGRDVYVTTGREGEKGKRLNWRLDANEITTIYPQEPAELIYDLYKIDSFVAQVQAKGDALLVAKFNVTGLEATLAPYKQLCNF